MSQAWCRVLGLHYLFNGLVTIIPPGGYLTSILQVRQLKLRSLIIGLFSQGHAMVQAGFEPGSTWPMSESMVLLYLIQFKILRKFTFIWESVHWVTSSAAGWQLSRDFISQIMIYAHYWLSSEELQTCYLASLRRRQQGTRIRFK